MLSFSAVVLSSTTFLDVFQGAFRNPKKTLNFEQMCKTGSPQCLANMQMPHVHPTKSCMTFADILLETKNKTKKNNA